MTKGTLLAAAVATVALALPASAASEGQAGGPYVLTALAGTGTVYYRCGKRGWALGIRIWSNTATTGVTFRAGGLAARRTLQPGDRHWFRFSHARLQALSTATGHEPDTIVGRVSVDFSSCHVYAPPAFSVREHLQLH